MARQVYIPGHFCSIGLVIHEEGEDEYLVQGITFSESQPAGPGPTFQPAWAMNATVIIQ